MATTSDAKEAVAAAVADAPEAGVADGVEELAAAPVAPLVFLERERYAAREIEKRLLSEIEDLTAERDRLERKLDAAPYPLTLEQEMRARALMSQHRYSREQAIIEVLGPISVADAKRFARVMAERERKLAE